MLLSQALAVKLSHDVLSWQIVFSGAPLPSSPLPTPCISTKTSFLPPVGGLLSLAVMASRNKIIAWLRSRRAPVDDHVGRLQMV